MREKNLIIFKTLDGYVAIGEYFKNVGDKDGNLKSEFLIETISGVKDKNALKDFLLAKYISEVEIKGYTLYEDLALASKRIENIIEFEGDFYDLLTSERLKALTSEAFFKKVSNNVKKIALAFRKNKDVKKEESVYELAKKENFSPRMFLNEKILTFFRKNGLKPFGKRGVFDLRHQNYDLNGEEIVKILKPFGKFPLNEFKKFIAVKKPELSEKFLSYGIEIKTKQSPVYEKLIEKLKKLEEFDENGDYKISENKIRYNAKRLYGVIKNKSRILVYGDFDADGIFSAAEVYIYLKTLKKLGAKIDVDIFFSDRNEGFGLTKERYEKFSEEYDFLILTDTGSELEYLNEGIENMLILDHHPAKKDYSFVVNPNIDNSNPYSTSGGKIVYDFLRIFHKGVKKVFSFDKDTEEGLFDVLKTYRGVTLISDMAILNKTNRNYIKQALEIIEEAPFGIFELIKNRPVTSDDLSFSVISKLNGLSRMNVDLNSVLKDIVFPNSSDVYLKIKELEKNHKNKMTEIKNVLKDIKVKDGIFVEYLKDNDKHGLNGLIANKIAMSYKIPAFVLSDFNDTHLVGSGRGKEVKRLFEESVKKCGIECVFGGHPDAFGFKIKKEDYKTLKDSLIETFKTFKSDYSLKEDFNVSLSEFVKLNEIYKELSEGVRFKDDLIAKVHSFSYAGRKLYKSGYAEVVLKDADNGDELSFFIDTNLTPVEEIKNAKEIYLGLGVGIPSFKKISAQEEKIEQERSFKEKRKAVKFKIS